MPDNRKDIQEFKSYGNPESPEELKIHVYEYE